MNSAFRLAVRRVALLNLGYFGVEVAVALWIGSVALLADGIDFLEDASLNFLILLALGWGVTARARLGMVLAGLLLVPGVVTLWMAWAKFSSLAIPAPVPLTLAGVGALIVNVVCAVQLAKFRSQGGSLARAAFLSARNDAAANLAIIAAGLITLATQSAWPDLLVGLGIMLLNAGAAVEVWKAARAERRATP